METPLASLAAAMICAGAYLFGGWLESSPRFEALRKRHEYLSAAAGISVAYVFVDVLPELEVQRQALVRAAGGAELLFAEKRIYFLALLSFVVGYGLEHMALVTHERRRTAVAAEKPDAVYWIQLVGYALYSALIGYLMVHRAGHGAWALGAYAFAMAVHFLIVDHALTVELGRLYAPRSRWMLAASVLLGWAISVVMPLSEVVVARLFAILAGGVVIAGLRAELPDDRTGRFWPFCVGAVVFALFLAFG